MTTDDALILRVREGDSHAFAAIFERYYLPLADFVERTLAARDEAEEVVEEVFLRVWERRAEWAPPGTIEEYLFRAARNGAVSRLRHARVVRRHEEQAAREDAAPLMGEAPPTSDDMLIADELRAAVAAALVELPPRCREVFLLRRQRRLSYADIATIMGTSVRTIEHQVAQANRLLRAALAKYLA